jgi:hypothetical protein
MPVLFIRSSHEPPASTTAMYCIYPSLDYLSLRLGDSLLLPHSMWVLTLPVRMAYDSVKRPASSSAWDVDPCLAGQCLSTLSSTVPRVNLQSRKFVPESGGWQRVSQPASTGLSTGFSVTARYRPLLDLLESSQVLSSTL